LGQDNSCRRLFFTIETTKQLLFPGLLSRHGVAVALTGAVSKPIAHTAVGAPARPIAVTLPDTVPVSLRLAATEHLATVAVSVAVTLTDAAAARCT
jgi:hypothetical protein